MDVDGVVRSGQANRLTNLQLVITPERSCWVSLPPDAASLIYGQFTGASSPFPVVLQLSVVPQPGSPVPRNLQRPMLVAWGGQAARTPGTLEMPAALAGCLGLLTGPPAGGFRAVHPSLPRVSLTVVPHNMVPAATSVIVEPVGPEDWEVCELNAGFLEDVMLSQMGVVALGQCFCAFARGGARAAFKTTALEPPEAAAKGVARLTGGVEVYVAPKPRVPLSHNTPSAPTPTTVSQPAPRPSATQVLPPSATNSSHKPTTASVRPPSAASAAASTLKQPETKPPPPPVVQPQRPPPPVHLRALPMPAALLLKVQGSGQNGSHASSAASETLSHTWLTTAVLVSPSDLALCNPSGSQPRGSWLSGGQLVNLRSSKGPAPLVHAPVVVVPCTECPPGHVMLAPPLLAATQIRPHTQVAVTPAAAVTVTAHAGAVPFHAGGAAAASRMEVAVHPVVWSDQTQPTNSAPAASANSTVSNSSVSAAAPSTGSKVGKSEPAASSQSPEDASTAALTRSLNSLTSLANLGSPEAAGGSPLLQALLAWWVSQRDAILALMRQSDLQQPLLRLQLPSGSLMHLQLPPNEEAAATVTGRAGQSHALSPHVQLLHDACLVVMVKGGIVTPQGGSRTDRATPCLDLTSLIGTPPPPNGFPPSMSSTAPFPLAVSIASHLQLPPPVSKGSSMSDTGKAPKGAESAFMGRKPTQPPATNHPTVWDAYHAVDVTGVRQAVESVSWLSSQLSSAVQRLAAVCPAPSARSGGTQIDRARTGGDRSGTTTATETTDTDSETAAIPATNVVSSRRVRGRAPAQPPPPPGHLLITGPAGSGRSAVAHAAASLLSIHPSYMAHVVTVRGSQLAGSAAAGGGTGSRGARAALEAALAEAIECAPSVVVLDDLDYQAPSTLASAGPESEASQSEQLESSQLAEWLSDTLASLSSALWEVLCKRQAAQGAAAAVAGGGGVGAVLVPQPPLPRVSLVACVRDAAGLHPALRQAGCFDFEVRLPSPGTHGRTALMATCQGGPTGAISFSQDRLAALAARAEGYETGDLRVLMDRAAHSALARALRDPAAATEPLQPPSTASTADNRQRAPQGGSVAVVGEGDVEAAVKGYTPPSFWNMGMGAGGKSEGEDKDKGWQDVGGLSEAKAALLEALALPFRHSKLVANAPLRLRTGLLLYGPPGCGKTHVVGAAVAALASELNIRFIPVKGPELLNKYIGASEASVRELFARAAAAAPCALFFDEFDAIAPPRGHDSTGVTDRVVNQLLTELDGVEGLRGVCVIGATSRPDLIDAALLRPGRLDRAVYCGLPNQQDREEILQALARKLPLGDDVDLAAIASLTHGLTGADLSAVLSEAQLAAVHEVLDAAEAAHPGETPPTPVICQAHLVAAAQQVRPSLPQAEAARLDAVYDAFRGGRAGGAAAASAAGSTGVVGTDLRAAAWEVEGSVGGAQVAGVGAEATRYGPQGSAGSGHVSGGGTGVGAALSPPGTQGHKEQAKSVEEGDQDAPPSYNIQSYLDQFGYSDDEHEKDGKPAGHTGVMSPQTQSPAQSAKSPSSLLTSPTEPMGGIATRDSAAADSGGGGLADVAPVVQQLPGSDARVAADPFPVLGAGSHAGLGRSKPGKRATLA